MACFSTKDSNSNANKGTGNDDSTNTGELDLFGVENNGNNDNR